MKLHLEIDPTVPGDLSAAYTVLNALKAKGESAGPTGAGTASAPAAPTPPASPAPAAPPAAAAIPPAPPPAAAPVAATPPPPSPVPGGVTQADLSTASQNYAKAYTPKGTKARFAQMSAALGVNWTKLSDIPADRYAEAIKWFEVQQ